MTIKKVTVKFDSCEDCPVQRYTGCEDAVEYGITRIKNSTAEMNKMPGIGSVEGTLTKMSMQIPMVCPFCDAIACKNGVVGTVLRDSSGSAISISIPKSEKDHMCGFWSDEHGMCTRHGTTRRGIKMLVGELAGDVDVDLLEKKVEFAKKLLIEHMTRLDRARAVVKKLEADLEAFKKLDVADLDVSDYRY